MTGGPFPPSSLPISTTQAIEILSSSGRRLITWTVWVLDEVEAYTQNYYGQLKERATGRGAIQVLVDRYTGRAMPGMGPNMTWNNKYGMMGGGIMERPRGSRSTAPATGSSGMCTAGGGPGMPDCPPIRPPRSHPSASNVPAWTVPPHSSGCLRASSSTMPQPASSAPGSNAVTPLRRFERRPSMITSVTWPANRSSTTPATNAAAAPGLP